MNRVFLLLVAIFLCVGCTTTSGILPFGPDTFTVRAENELNGNSAKNKAVMKANEHCEALGKHFMPVSSTSSHISYDLTFRCLDAGDPELTRPDWGAAPDVVVENK